MNKEPDKCPIYGTVYCPMCWISYGFEKILRFRGKWNEIFNEKQSNLIHNLISTENLPSYWHGNEGGRYGAFRP